MTKMSILGTEALNHGRHIGLQQLEVLAAAAHSFLGPNKHYKFIQDEASGESALVCSCYRLLEQLELSSSVGQLLHETTRAHQETLHSGTGTLIFLAGVWSRVALECLHKNISIAHIIAGMSKGLDLSLEACRCNAVTLEEFACKSALQKQLNDGGHLKSAADGLSAVPLLDTGGRQMSRGTISPINGVLHPGCIKEQLSVKHRIKLKHSRHFNSSSIKAEGTQSVEPSNQKCSKIFDLVHLAEAVSHGCEASMRLVLEACRIQSGDVPEGQGFSKLDVDRLVTCPLPGLPEEHSCVLHGFVIMSCVEQVSLVRHFKERTLNVGIVNGDLTETYRHIGFSKPKNTTYITDRISTGVSREAEWTDRALGILLNLSVDVLLVSGMVSTQLKNHCLSHNILVISRMRATILNEFAKATGAVPVSYVTQLSERCVGTGVCVRVLREYRGTGNTESTLLNIVASGTSLVTAVIANSVHAKVQSLEDQFWSCAYRLHHALKDRKLLPGAGAAELLCIHQISKCVDVSRSITERRMDATSPHEQEILRLMAEGWMDYISTLMVKNGQVMAKAQAWTQIAQLIKNFETKNPLKTFCTNEIQGERENAGETMVEKERVGVYDNVTVKFEAWRRALDLVFLILQTDAEIITGIDVNEHQHQDVMLL